MALPLWLSHYGGAYEPLVISPATIDRLLSLLGVECGRLICGTKPGSILKKNRNEEEPGFLEQRR